MATIPLVVVVDVVVCVPPLIGATSKVKDTNSLGVLYESLTGAAKVDSKLLTV